MTKDLAVCLVVQLPLFASKKRDVKGADPRNDRAIERSAHRLITDRHNIVSHVLAAKYSARKGRGSLCLRVCTLKYV